MVRQKKKSPIFGLNSSFLEERVFVFFHEILEMCIRNGGVIGEQARHKNICVIHHESVSPTLSVAVVTRVPSTAGLS